MRTIGLILVTIGFLVGALAAIAAPDRVHMVWFVPAAVVAAAGVALARLAARKEAGDATRVEGNFAILDEALGRIVNNARSLDASKASLDVYALPPKIDSTFLADIAAFAGAREAILHIWGSRAYADVMTPFAAGERYLNRAWSTAADGYIDEAHACLGAAREQLEAALAILESLRASRRSDPRKRDQQ